jgi:hypothetical protein
MDGEIGVVPGEIIPVFSGCAGYLGHPFRKEAHERGQSYPPRNPFEQRREFLWRERVKLELQVQSFLTNATTLHQKWQHLQARKAALGNQVPKVAGQILRKTQTIVFSSALPAVADGTFRPSM